MLRKVGVVGSTSTRCFSIAANTASGVRSATVTTAPPWLRVWKRVLMPPMWSRFRKDSVRRGRVGAP